MTIRKWFYLFWTTTFIGTGISVLVGLILQLSDADYNQVGMKEWIYSIVFMLIGGAMISVLSQMGFFAYLIVRYIAIGIFRKRIVWEYIQLLSMIAVLFDSVYFRRIFSQQSDSIFDYVMMPSIVFLIALGVAFWKAKLTNWQAFIPTLVFMVVVTILEAVPAIKLDQTVSSIFMIAPLIVCNAWQILILPKVLKEKEMSTQA
jgi:KinB signaling pathway activation protein